MRSIYKIHTNNKYCINILAILFSLIATAGITEMIKGEKEYLSFSNSIFSILAFFVVCLTWKYTFNHLKRKGVGWSIALSVFFSASLCLGSNLLEYGYSYINQITTFRKIIEGSFFWAPIITIIIDTIPKAYRKLRTLDSGKIYKFSLKHPKALYMIEFLLIYFSWMPIFLASYPGIYGYDSVYQIEYYTSHHLVLNHPFIHTLLLGFFTVTVGNFLGSVEKGFSIYILIQMGILCFAFSELMRCLRKWNIPQVFRLFTLALVILLPTNAVMAISSTKDTIYSATFLLLLLQLANAVVNRNYFDSHRTMVATTVILFFNLIFRNNAIYVNVLALIIALICFHDRKLNKKISINFCVTFLCFIIYSGPITTALGGVKTDSLHEMMSVPVMQLSRSAIMGKEQLTEDDIEEIEKYIPNYAKYLDNQEGISDLMKNSFNSDLFRKDPIHFLKLYFRIGTKCPTAYVDAFLRMTIGLWYPDMNYRDPQAYHPYWEYKNTVNNGNSNWLIIQRKTMKGFEGLESLMNDLAYNNTYQKIPVISLLFSSGFYVWIMLLFFLYSLRKRKYILLAPWGFLFSLWLTLLLGPVVLYRYMYPFIICTPLLIALLLHQEEIVNSLEVKKIG